MLHGPMPTRSLLRHAMNRYPEVSPVVCCRVCQLAESRYPPVEGWSNCTLDRIHESLDKAAMDLIVETKDCDVDLLFAMLQQ